MISCFWPAFFIDVVRKNVLTVSGRILGKRGFMKKPWLKFGDRSIEAKMTAPCLKWFSQPGLPSSARGTVFLGGAL